MHIKHIGKGKCRLMAKNISQLEPIRNFFKVDNPSKFFVEYHCSNVQVSDYIYGISTIGVFNTGLLMSVLKVLKTLHIQYTVDKEIIKEYFPFKALGIKTNIKSLPNDGKMMPGGFILEPREYQTIASEKFLKHGRGVIVLPTASGKSYVVAKTLYSLLQNDKISHCLIYVPNTSLVKQFYNDLLDYGIPEDMISRFCSSSKKDKICKNTPIIISNRQWLEHHVKELPHIDVLFVDECHMIKHGNKVSEMIHNFDTNIRFGCTATLPNSIEDRWELVGLIGPVLYKKPVTEMIDDNFISDLNITSIQVTDTKIEKDTHCLFSLNRKIRSKDIAEPYANERDYIAENIIKLYEKPVKYIKHNTKGTNTLWLFDFIEFGQSLYSFIKNISDNPDNVYYIDGTIDVNIREEIINCIENGTDIDIIAQSTCFSTGINSKNLHNIAFVFNSKSDTKVMQSIGRGLRKHKSKTYFNLYDINFKFKYSSKHHLSRRNIYTEHYNKDITSVVKFTV